MYKNKTVSVVIPVHNEEKLIKPTLENVSNIFDRIFVVDDGSNDNTVKVVEEMMKKDNRITLLKHHKNLGVGQAIITGYKKSYSEGYDLTVVIGGDFQMDLAEVGKFLDPLLENKADYTKGNRFLFERAVFDRMPKIRLIGNTILSLITKIASGYYKIFDVVDGYTATTRKVLGTIDWDRAWKGYGYPMDFLIRLNIYGFRVMDIPRRPIYLKGERQSQIKGFSYLIKVLPLLVKGFFWRMINKYIFRDFHPLVFFYFLGLLFLFLGFILGGYIVFEKLRGGTLTGPTAVLCGLLIILGAQGVIFGMLFEMMEERK